MTRTLDIQNALIAATDIIADFTVTDRDDGQIRVAYTVVGDDEMPSETFFRALEERLGLEVVSAGSSGDGFYVTYSAAE